MTRKTFPTARMNWSSLSLLAALLAALSCFSLPTSAAAPVAPLPESAPPVPANSRSTKSESVRGAAFNDDQQGRLAFLRDWLRKRSSERHNGRAPAAGPRIAAYRLSPPPQQKERRFRPAVRWKRQEPTESAVIDTARGFERGPDGRVRHRYQFSADTGAGLESATTDNAGEAGDASPKIHIGGKHYYRVAGEIRLGTYGSAENASGDRSNAEGAQSAELATGQADQSQTAKAP